MEKALDFLLKYLTENGDHAEPIPQNNEDKWLLFRSLVNVRPPNPISEEFLETQDKLLKSRIQEKGIVDIRDLSPIRDNLYLWRGDITTLKADAIVNAANNGMLGCFVPNHACIDNAIHTFAGVQLRLDCAAIMEIQEHPEPTGQAKITAAYNLPSKYVLHTVGPIISGFVSDEDKRLLAGCYRSCLELAGQYKLESVAFCCISTGEYRFPNKDAAEIAVDTVNEWLSKSQCMMKVIFDVFTEKDQRIYEELLG